MSERADQLLGTADGQIAELIGLLSNRGETVLGLPCLETLPEPQRAKSAL